VQRRSHNLGSRSRLTLLGGLLCVERGLPVCPSNTPDNGPCLSVERIVLPIRDTVVLTNPFTATNGSPIITVADTAHGCVTGDFVTYSGATGLGGNITAAVLNAEHQVTVVNANSFTIQTTYLTATTTPTVSIALYYVLGSGNVNSVSSFYGLETTPQGLIVNLNEPMPNNRYSIVSISSYSHPNLDDTDTSPATQNPSPNQTTNSFRLINNYGALYINMVVFG